MLKQAIHAVSAVCISCHRRWEVSVKTCANPYICPDCDKHMARLRTAWGTQQLVRTAGGLGYITGIESDGMICAEVSGRACKFWPLDIEPMRHKS